MRRTKIVCTVGPACRSEENFETMVKLGMNVARINFSHDTHAYHQTTIGMLKRVRKHLGMPLAIMLDTKGPEIRLRCFEGEKAELKAGDAFTLTAREIKGNSHEVSINRCELPRCVTPGTKILVDDGTLEFAVESVTDTDINCRVITGGTIKDRKGVNVPGLSLDLPYLSADDKRDLLFGIRKNVDFIAASFVRSGNDVRALRAFLDENGGQKIRIIAKIENPDGINNFDDIMHAADGIMVARGDMAVEIEYERLPGLQKQIIKRCYSNGKIVITATQMLDSMIKHPSPTRAEITDVANAVFDGTSAVMLSGETAAGSYPIEALSAMVKIVSRAEIDAAGNYRTAEYATNTTDVTNAICDAACTTARDIHASAIITLTQKGSSACNLSKFRPKQPIVAVTPDVKNYHQLSLCWGVQPLLSSYQRTDDALMSNAVSLAKAHGIVHDGDYTVIVAGLPLNPPTNINTIRVKKV